MSATIRLDGLGALLALFLSIAPQVAGQEARGGQRSQRLCELRQPRVGRRRRAAPGRRARGRDPREPARGRGCDAHRVHPRADVRRARGSSRSTCARSNRALLRFGPVHGPVRKAEIVLTVDTRRRTRTRRRSLPAAPFEIGAYEVRERLGRGPRELGHPADGGGGAVVDRPHAPGRGGGPHRRHQARPRAWPTRTPRRGAG